MRQIGVSILSFGPGIFFPGGYRKVADTLNGLGMGVQLMPLRGFQEKYIDYFSNVMSFEGPWNCGSLKGVLRRHVLGDSSCPSLIDLGLFGSESACRDRISMLHHYCPKALAIDVPWIPDSLIEIGPNMYVGNARAWHNSQPSGLVLDTHHWRMFTPNLVVGEMNKFGGISAIKMVHLKLLSSKETFDFLYNPKDENFLLLREFLSWNRRACVPVIIEAGANALGDVLNFTAKETLESIKRRIEQIV